MAASVQSTQQSAPGEAHSLRSAGAVRERCGLICDWVAAGRSPHFTLAEGRLPAVADYVADVTRANYPDLVVPCHSRWRHFCAGGADRWSRVRARFAGDDPVEVARAAVDLATVSVLLDAGAGEAWRYREAATGRTFARSEGLAVASIDMFAAGGFSSDADRPLRVDSRGLDSLSADSLARYFQVAPDNPLVGAQSRAGLLNNLGHAIEQRPDLFGGAPARPGNIVDHLLGRGREVAAPALLTLLLDALSPIWPSGLAIGDVPLGDAGRHPAILAAHAADGIVPFHKLTQWLVYSLIEPLETAGLRVVDLDGLTALAEYRNGGLLLDLGVIRPRQPLDPALKHKVDSELVVEWRALTVDADGPPAAAGARPSRPRRHVHAPASSAGRHLERRPQDRADIAPARRPTAARGRRRRHGVLNKPDKKVLGGRSAHERAWSIGCASFGACPRCL